MKKYLLIFSALTLTTVGGIWLATSKQKVVVTIKPPTQIKSYEACKSAGYAITGTDQKVCTTPEGIEFNEPKVSKNTEYLSLKGRKLTVTEPLTNSTIKSPLTIKGNVQGSWSFEASFPVNILDSNGKVIGEIPAKLLGEWTTDNYVPFEATITFDAQPSGSRGIIILKKDNPSGLPENDDSISIPIIF